jgi:monoamine oxidase
LASVLKPGSVVLNSPVRSVHQTSSGIEVGSARGDFLAKKVIVAIPTPLYYEIDFSPPLSQDKLTMSRGTVHGYTAKFIVAYSHPWWRAHGLCGLVQSPHGTLCIIRDTSVDGQGLYALTCFAEGDAGRAWSKLSAQERRAAALDHIRRAFGPFVGGEDKVPEPIETIEQEWWKDQWSQGCPCPAFPPGLMSEAGHALREKHGAVHFAGTELSYEWKGYMEGAVRSGETAAAEVVKALQTDPKS